MFRAMDAAMTPAQIRAWRKRLGLSLTDAAEVLGVERRTYMRWESGDRPVSRTVAKLAGMIERAAQGRPALGVKDRVRLASAGRR